MNCSLSLYASRFARMMPRVPKVQRRLERDTQSKISKHTRSERKRTLFISGKFSELAKLTRVTGTKEDVLMKTLQYIDSNMKVLL